MVVCVPVAMMYLSVVSNEDVFIGAPAFYVSSGEIGNEGKWAKT